MRCKGNARGFATTRSSCIEYSPRGCRAAVENNFAQELNSRVHYFIYAGAVHRLSPCASMMTCCCYYARCRNNVIPAAIVLALFASVCLSRYTAAAKAKIYTYTILHGVRETSLLLCWAGCMLHRDTHSETRIIISTSAAANALRDGR